MPISLLRSDRTPRISWKYSAHNLIWRVLPTPDGLFIGEERDPVAREATFFCVDGGDGAILWERLTLGEGWWTGFAGCTGGVLLLHGYATPDLPQHLKIFAADVRTGASLWNNDSVTFDAVRGDEVHATTTGGERVVLEARTGARLPDRESVVETPPPDEPLQFPRPLDTGERGLRSVMKDLLKEDVPESAEVLEVADHLVVGYCRQRNRVSEGHETFEQDIAVIDPRRRKVVYSDRLLEHTSVPVPDAFFARRGMLYYIRERQHLVGVRFPPPVS